MWTDIVSSVKTISDLLISLLGQGTTRRKHLFESHVEPVFNQLMTVHEDYASAIAEVIGLVRDYRVSPTTIRERLVERSRNLQHVRRLVRDMADAAYASKRTALTKAFAWSVSSYFICTIGQEEPWPDVTWMKGITGLVDEVLRGRLTRDGFEFELCSIEKALQFRWSNVTREYAKLRVECLGRA